MLNDITILDFETTGLDSVNDRVVEMAALRVIDGQIHSQWHTLVNPEGVMISAKAQEINKLTDEQVAKGRTPLQSFAILRNFLGDSTIVAHNAAFDLDFLNINYLRLERPELTNHFLCTRTVAAFRYPAPHSLESLCPRFNITNENAHRAMSDVNATYALLLKFMEVDGLEEFVNVLGYDKRFGLPKWKPAYAILRGY